MKQPSDKRKRPDPSDYEFKPPSGKNLIIILLLFFSPILLINGCLILGPLTQMGFDRLSGPLQMADSVSATSPDRKIRFEVGVDGTAHLIEVATSRVLYTQQIPPEDYKSIEVRWQDNQHVLVMCMIRYPVTSFGRDYLWDSKSGNVTASWSSDIHDFKSN